MKKLLTITITLLFIAVLSGCKPSIEDNIIFDLILGDDIFIEIGDVYTEPGLIVRYEQEDLMDYISVEGNVNTAIPGVYMVTYTLEYKGVTIQKIRTITVDGFNFECDEVPELVVEDFNDSLINTECENITDTDLMICQVIWSGTYLNTVVKVNIYVDQDTTFNTNEAFHEIETIIARYTMTADKYKQYGDIPSVCTINKDSGTETIIDQDLYDLIEYTMENQYDIEDYYDATLGTLLNVWHDYRDNCNNTSVCSLPSESLLEAANQFTGSYNVYLNENSPSITLQENTTIDLGGMSKGYVSKLIAEYLDTLDIQGYLVNNGESNISIGGTHPIRENGKFIIGITNPESIYNIYATTYLSDGEQLVTSGDYQKYFEVEGEIYHHIIDPTTLMPASKMRSVSIIATDAALADLYSTAIFNMTIEDGQIFVNSIAGLEAIWFGMDGTIYYSDNFEEDYLVELY